jgi:hypothetical protein
VVITGVLFELWQTSAQSAFNVAHKSVVQLCPPAELFSAKIDLNNRGVSWEKLLVWKVSSKHEQGVAVHHGMRATRTLPTGKRLQREAKTRAARRMRSLGSFASQGSPMLCLIVRMKRFLISYVFGALLISMAHAATNFELAAKATNELGVDLYRQLATGEENLCISPYSIDSALAMTFAGADGETRREMARVLHFPNDGGVPASFSALQQSIEQMSAKTAELVKDSKESKPITLNIANRLFAQKGYHFREAYLSLVKQNFGGAFEPLDFVADPAAATQRINSGSQTRRTIEFAI